MYVSERASTPSIALVRACAPPCAQLYLAYPKSAGEPPQQLRGFKKLQLAAGASATVTFNVDAPAVWDAAKHEWAAVAGEFGVAVGASSRDIRLKGTLTHSSVPPSTPSASGHAHALVSRRGGAKPPPPLTITVFDRLPFVWLRQCAYCVRNVMFKHRPAPGAKVEMWK